VDELMLVLKGDARLRFTFQQADIYGYIVVLCEKSYMPSTISYKDKEEQPSTDLIPMQYVLKLCESLYGTNRNVTVILTGSVLP
jgi:hypothetical protein